MSLAIIFHNLQCQWSAIIYYYVMLCFGGIMFPQLTCRYADW